jgi:hypothetical protein
MGLAKKLRDMHALAADSCDPEYSRALLEAADEIERLSALIHHASDCAVYNEPALPAGPCDCGAEPR